MKLKRNGKSKSRRRRNVIHKRSKSRRRNRRTKSRRSRKRSKSRHRNRSRKSKNIIKYNKFQDGLKKPEFDFKLIELKGCGYCKDAKKLILDNNYTIEVKQTLSPEEEKEIKNTVKEYPYYPKIFKYNNTKKKYDFIGGFDKLQELLKNKN